MPADDPNIGPDLRAIDCMADRVLQTLRDDFPDASAIVRGHAAVTVLALWFDDVPESIIAERVAVSALAYWGTPEDN